jgi:hemerythrin superfamily protein
LPDIVTLIKAQHREIERLLEQAQNEHSDTLSVLRQIETLLSPHSEAEESFVYPRISALQPNEDDEVKDGAAEHHHVASVLKDLLADDPDSPGYDGKLAGLVGELLHHVQEEEEELLPVLADKASDEERDALGARFLAATGTAAQPPADDATRDELYQLAKERDIPGRSSMSKGELNAAVREA